MLLLLLLAAAPPPLEAVETTLRKTLGAEVTSGRVVVTREEAGLTVQLASEELFTKLDGLWKTLSAVAHEPRAPLRVEFDAPTARDCAHRERLVALHLFLKRRAPANFSVRPRCTVPATLELGGLVFEAKRQLVSDPMSRLGGVEFHVRNPGAIARTVKFSEPDLLPLRRSTPLESAWAQPTGDAPPPPTTLEGRELVVPPAVELRVMLRFPPGTASFDTRARRVWVEVDGARGVIEGPLVTMTFSPSSVGD